MLIMCPTLHAVCGKECTTAALSATAMHAVMQLACSQSLLLPCRCYCSSTLKHDTDYFSLTAAAVVFRRRRFAGSSNGATRRTATTQSSTSGLHEATSSALSSSRQPSSCGTRSWTCRRAFLSGGQLRQLPP